MANTPRERFLAALRGEHVRPVPVGAITQPATLALMQATGAWWPQAHRDAESMARLAASAHTEFGFDFVRVPFDQTIEAEVLGVDVDLGSATSNCSLRSHPYSPDYDGSPSVYRYQVADTVLDAVPLLRKHLGDSVGIVGGVVGPFTLLCQLAGVTAVLMRAVRRPASLKAWLDFVVDFAAIYAGSQVEAGAEAICVEDMSASLELTSPGIYRNLILPAQQELIRRIQAPVILHVCGNNTKIIDLLHQTGAAALSLEDRTDLARAAAGPCAIIGGVAPVEVLLNGTIEDVHRASKACLAACVHVLAPGCGLVPETKTENIRAMVLAAREMKQELTTDEHG